MGVWSRAGRAGWSAAAAFAVLALSLAAWPSGARAQTTGSTCVSPTSPTDALRVSLVSAAPAELCTPSYQIVEVRNISEAPLRDVTLTISPPSGQDQWSFASDIVEISDDDGATWRRVQRPISAAGFGQSTSGAPAPSAAASGATSMTWTATEIPALVSLGRAGGRDDSLLVRWRAVMGQDLGGAFAPEARLGLGAEARDVCGRQVSAPRRLEPLPILQPRLAAALTGRNLTRGGRFSDRVAAAPGDEIEWRVELENLGEVLARAVRARVSVGGDAPLGMAPLSGESGLEDQGFSDGVLSLRNLVETGRRTVRLREIVGPACGVRPVQLEATWGCRAPPQGQLSALSDPAVAIATAELSTAPSGADLTVRQEILGVDGSLRPGDAAVVRIAIENNGPPIFEPSLEIVLPDGYVFDPSHAVELFAPGGDIGGVALDAERPESPTLRLTGGDDDAVATLDPGGRLQLSFRAIRSRPGVLDRDESTATLSYRDGCGLLGRAAPVRTPVSPRQADVALSILPIGDPLISGPGETRRFLAAIVNEGEETARRLSLRLDLGAGWVDAPPQGCSPGDRPRRFVCPISGSIGPGRAIESAFALETADGDGPLDVRASAFVGGGAIEGDATTRSGAVGFQIEQRVLGASGRPRPADAPLDLGERVAIEVSARFFGLGDGAAEGVSVAQTLPPSLAYRGSEQIDGALTLDTALEPDAGGGGRLLWSLEDVEEDGAFVARVYADVVDPGEDGDAAAGDPTDVIVGGERIALGPQALDQHGPIGFAEASAVFSSRGRAFGVDPLLGGPTRAEPLRLTFRRPEIAVSLLAATGAPGAVDLDRSGAAVITASGGDRLVATLRLDNDGDAPAYLDWLTLSAPGFLSLVPLGADGVDNDDDGAVDEADEASDAVVEPGPDGVRLRWMTLRPPSRTPATAQRMVARSSTVRRVAFDVAPDVTPDAQAPLRLEARFGATPSAVAGGFAGERWRRDRVSRELLVRTPTVRGFLVLSATSLGGDLSSTVRHGEEIEHRLSLRFPTGSISGVAAELAYPPSLTDVEVVGFRIGPGLRCEGIRAPKFAIDAPVEDAAATPDDGAETTGGGDPDASASKMSPLGGRLRWPLGDCLAALGAGETERVALLDVAARVVDADPSAPDAERAAWRRPVVAARLISADDDDGVDLGQSALTIAGPALLVTATGSSDGDAPLDASDPFKARVRIENVGDAPARAVTLRAQRPAGGGIDCAALSLSAAGAVAAPASASSAGDRTCGPMLSHGADTLAPGEALEHEVRGVLGRTAAIARTIEMPFVARAALSDGAAPLIKNGVLRLEAAAPSPPTAGAVGAGGRVRGEPGAVAVVGDVFRIETVHTFPEGRAPAELSILVRLRSARPEAVIEDAGASLRVVGATLARRRADLMASENPSGVNAAPVGSRVAVDDLIAVADAEEGWRRVSIPLGFVSLDAPQSRRGAGVFAFEAVLALDDGPAASEGRVLEARASTRVRDQEVDGAAIEVARIAEPFVDLALTALDRDAFKARTSAIVEANQWRGATAASPVGVVAALRGVACNRGSAPAYGLSLSLAPPSGYVFDTAQEPVYRRLETVAGLAPQRYGTASIAESGVSAAPSAATVEIDVGACVELIAPLRPTSESVGASARPAELIAERYQGRPSVERPGRLYQRAARETAAIVPPGLAISAPNDVALGPGAAAGALDVAYPIVVDARAVGPDARLSLDIEGPAFLGWTLHRDRNADGVVDQSDPLWRDGDPVGASGQVAVIARAQALSPPPEEWRHVSMLRAVVAAEDGRVFSATRELVLSRAPGRIGVLSARRVMAVDRDCDGALDDEATRDGVFAAAQEAAPGECVVMRLLFENRGAATLESVSIDDRLFEGAAFIRGSARFVETPIGLVAGVVDTPTARRNERDPKVDGAAGRVRFGFVGALSPGLRGAVEYRVRLSAP